MTQRTHAEVQADMDQLDADYNAAVSALKSTAYNDERRAGWHYTVAVYRGRRANLIAERLKANRGDE